MKHVISANQLTKQFRSRQNKSVITGLYRPNWKYYTAVDAIDLIIEEGESVAFLGPNGAGKTTTTKMMTGLICPTSGELRVLGQVPFDRNPEFLKQIGLVMGNKAGLNWDLSANQSFELLQKIYAIPPKACRERVERLSELLRVTHVLDAQVRKLSLGERMKLELISALLHDPKVLFLDEPTIGLDIDAKKSIRTFLKTLHAEGKTIVLTSHDMDDISAVCKRAVVINHGIIIYDGPMSELKEKYSKTRYLKLHFNSSVPEESELEKHGEIVKIEGLTLVMRVPQDQVMHIATNLSKKHAIRDIAIEQVALEEIISDVFAGRLS